MDKFSTPPDHVNFLAKKLFGACGEIKDGAIAYIEPNGGGPTEMHTHSHDHLFIIVKGEALIKLGDTTVSVRENESYLVKGEIPHSVWNKTDEEIVMIGISVENNL